jgi:hypothetical protein
MMGERISEETVSSMWKDMTDKPMPKIEVQIVGNDQYNKVFERIKNSPEYKDLSLEIGEIKKPAVAEDSAGFTTKKKDSYLIIIRTTDWRKKHNEIRVDIAIESWQEVLRHELQHIIRKQI